MCGGGGVLVSVRVCVNVWCGGVCVCVCTWHSNLPFLGRSISNCTVVLAAPTRSCVCVCVRARAHVRVLLCVVCVYLQMYRC